MVASSVQPALLLMSVLFSQVLFCGYKSGCKSSQICIQSKIPLGLSQLGTTQNSLV